MKEHLLELLGYHDWATRKILNHLAKLPSHLYRESMVSVFPSLSQVVNHLYDVDQIWYARINKDFQRVERDLDNIRNALSAFESLHHEMVSFVRTQDPRMTIHYRNSKGESFTNRLEEIIHHIVNHGTYHRGNIAAMLRQLGQTGVSTDYIYYLREMADQS
ncbi:Nuclease inhibitor [[Clostridium] ultunense Esp]|uniref:DinB family protein n=1 Tax=Thermicanus aegyptius TaxID=94009 RepID=UPI0002B70C2E|nr:DinB family protein [Thermicanus aegyptius]CCQ96509.1 Nuclease inhibitor [[Clostridium] ultunense Esp]